MHEKRKLVYAPRPEEKDESLVTLKTKEFQRIPILHEVVNWYMESAPHAGGLSAEDQAGNLGVARRPNNGYKPSRRAYKGNEPVRSGRVRIDVFDDLTEGEIKLIRQILAAVRQYVRNVK